MMSENYYKVAVIPGDGTGPEVVTEGLKALNAVSRKCVKKFQFKEFRVGGEYYMETGNLLTEEVLEELKK